MSPTSWSRWSRLSVVVCGLVVVLVVHVSLRYLESTLFGFVTYRGLAPPAPFLVFGVHVLLFATLGGLAAIRRGKPGIVLGAGLLLLAAEPLASSYTWGDGCEVGRSAGTVVFPDVTAGGMAVTLYSWSGSCTATLTTGTVGLAVLLVGVGLWMGSVPDAALTRWTTIVEAYWPSRSSA